MQRFLLSSAVVLALLAGGFYAYQAVADTAPNAAPGMAPDGPDHPPGPLADGWGPGPDGRGFGPGHHRHGDDFSLFARVPDKNLSASDVKVIATAILLEHGNHDWTVTDVAAQSDKSIDFSFATPHGDVVATFALDPDSGHIKRLS